MDPVDLVLLEEKLDALRQAADDLVLARMHQAHVDGRSAVWQGDAPVAGAFYDLEGVRVLEQCLGWNTPPDQAGAAERLLLLDDHNLLPELGRTNRGDIATGTRTDDDDII